MEKRLIAVLSAAFCMLTASALPAYAADAYVEQIQCVMPQIHVYLRADDGLSGDQVAAYLDSEQLSDVDAEPFSESGEAVHYYVLLDSSGSVPKTYTQPLKDAVLEMGAHLRSNDRITVRTAGESVQMLYDGSGRDADFAAAVDLYQPDEQETLLFEGLAKCAEQADKEAGEQFERNVLFVFSDGVNESVGVTVRDEAAAKLKDVQLPVYAFGLGNDSGGLDLFGQLARDTGGTLQRVQPDETAGAVSAQMDALMQDYIITLGTGSNRTGNARELLLQISDYQFAQTVTLHPKRWVPDTEAPQVTALTRGEDGHIRVDFSEHVEGADVRENYKVACSNDPVPVRAVRYFPQEDGTSYALLELGDLLYSGNYEVHFYNITDASQEQNPLSTDSFSAAVVGSSSQTEKSVRLLWKHMWWVIPVCLIGVIALVTLRVIRRHKGIVQQDGSIVFQDALQSKVHITNAAGSGIQLYLTVQSAQTLPTEITTVLNQAVMFGRSSQCQVYFDDTTMSRQHFQIFQRDGALWAADCGSTSGTQVNGVPAHEPVMLHPGDTVSAGLTKITVRW